MTSMNFKRWLIAGIAITAVACSGDDDGGDDMTTNRDGGVVNNDGGTEDPRVTACKSTVAAKETQFAADITGWSIEDASEMTATGGDQTLEADFAGKYRDDLANHPGCAPRAMYGANMSEPFVSDNEATVPGGSPAAITGYDCAAKEYTQANEDTTKPIVILVHGNSSGVTSFEEYFTAALSGTTITNLAGFEVVVDTAVREQLATKLIADGYRVIGFDARVDAVATLGDYSADQMTGNPFLNIDHGWIVPPLQSLIKAVMTNNPSRKVSVIGHSLGVTAVRDALRRLYVENKAGAAGSVNPFAQLQDVILLSGANHGVSSGPACETVLGEIMRGTVTCEMGDRTAFQPTYFSRPLNGPGDLYTTPCADGDFAYGEHEQCGGNVVEYTTVTMEDIPNGDLQDEFVSEASSALDNGGCVENELITLGDYDTSGYFFTGAPGFLANHFGSARSNAGVQLILDKLAD
ncbi:MAG: alpha/beta hydrolase [Deltaproteobacteria bacterium]|jgi:hypothetical protein